MAPMVPSLDPPLISGVRATAAMPRQQGFVPDRDKNCRDSVRRGGGSRERHRSGDSPVSGASCTGGKAERPCRRRRR